MRAARITALVIAGTMLAACAPNGGQAQQSVECFVRGTSAEQARERPSPLATTAITLGGDEATVCYGRPSARGRTVMGELVPYGTPWRMGANEATAIHLPFAAEIGGVRVDPGVYSIYAVPGETTWTVVVNSSAERWGIPINDEVKSTDVGSFERTVSATSAPVETLTYEWVPEGDGAGQLVMTWENTRLEIPIRRVGA